MRRTDALQNETDDRRRGVAAACLAGCGDDGDSGSDRAPVILATTTSTQDSGLLDVLDPGVRARDRLPGQDDRRRQRRGDRAGRARRGRRRAGPLAGGRGGADGRRQGRRAAAGDVQRLRDRRARRTTRRASSGATAAEALDAIAEAGAPFISRGDESGTHTFELGLWEDAGVDARGRAGTRSPGQGMGATLQIANEQGRATRSPTAAPTWPPTSARDLEVLVEGDADLLNIYHVIDDRRRRRRARQRRGRQGVRRLARRAGGARTTIGDVRRRRVRPAAVRPGRRQDRGRDRAQAA